MTRDVINEISEVIGSFNKEELSELLKRQLEENETEINGIPMDYFKPIWVKYSSVMTDFDMNGDTRTDIQMRFNDLSMIFIAQIRDAFNLEIDSNWVDTHSSELPGLALALYSFFVMELVQNIEDVVHMYLNKNEEMLATVFDELKTKKDASTILFAKNLSESKALLVANIHKVSRYIIENMDEEEFLECLPDGYVPGDILRSLYDDGYVTGTFMDVIRDMYNSSSYLRSTVSFNILSSYRKNQELPVSK